MLRKKKARFAMESLEERWTPALAVLGGGALDLVVAGTPTGAVVITQTADGEFSITDNGSPVGAGTYTTARDLFVKLGNAADDVTVDLGDFTAPEDVRLWLGNGNNILSVGNGAIAGDLIINGFRGTDGVTLGDSESGLSIGDDLFINLDGAGDDTAILNSDVTVGDDFVATYVNDLTISAGAAIEDDALIIGGTAGNTVQFDGTVGHNLAFWGSVRSNVSDSFTMSSSASVARDLILYTDSIYLNFGGADTVSLDGSVGNQLFLNAGGGADTVTLGENFALTGTTPKLRVYLGHGNDTFNNNATLAANTTGTVDGGAGSGDILNEGISLPGSVTKPNFP